MPPIIQIIDVHKSFGDHAVLKGIDLTIEKGETFALIGPSGKGKSVLLKHIIGLLKPDSGKILIDGQDINHLNHEKLKILKNRIGMVFQFGALFDSLTVYENVAFPLTEKTKLTQAQIRDKVMKELASVGMEKEADKYLAQISGGMKKRVAAARCLVMDPEILLFDEPTTGLDPVTSNSIYNIIKKLNQERHMTSFIISHEIPEIFDVVDRAAMIYNGKIAEVGPSDQIRNSKNPIVQHFLKGEAE